MQSIKNIIINLQNVNSKMELLKTFHDKLSFPKYFGYNWDALHDLMSDISYMDIKEKHIHLILENYNSFISNFPNDDRIIFEHLLVIWTDNTKRKIKFSFEVR